MMASKGVKSVATLEDITSEEIGDWMPTGLMKVLSKILLRHVCDEAELRCRKEKAAAILLTRQQTQTTLAMLDTILGSHKRLNSNTQNASCDHARLFFANDGSEF